MEIPLPDKKSSLSLPRQIFQWIKNAAMDGTLSGGEILPATRELARHMGISRNTVCEAYELLAAEGYIDCSQGRRAQINPGLILRSPQCSQNQYALEVSPGNVSISHDFRTGKPELPPILLSTWQKALSKAVREAAPENWQYGSPEGEPNLRKEISAYLFRARGIRVPAYRVFITAGATHALHIAASLFARRAGRAAVEDPCHNGMGKTLRKAGLELIPIPIDEFGIRTEYLTEEDLVYITPSHQFPLGGVLPAARRTQLINWARTTGGYIIEDDYDAEFRYSGPPIAPLWVMDPEHVVYVGTFSKTLFPALRIGYSLVPKDLQKEWIQTRILTDVQNPPFEQLALARLLAERTVDRHIARMRRLYARRRSFLIHALHNTFENTAELLGDSAGLHLAIRFRDHIFDKAFTEAAFAAGIAVSGVDRHTITKGVWFDTLLLGYGHLDEKEIEMGIQALSECIRENKDRYQAT